MVKTLSEKMIQTGGSDGFLAYDVKQFIKDIKEEIQQTLPEVTGMVANEIINKRAGEKLI